MAITESTDRRSARYAFPARIEYVLDSGGNEVFQGVTINISSCGMSIYAFAPLPKGQKIIITSVLPVEHRAATIRWVKQEHSNMYKIGLKFIREIVKNPTTYPYPSRL
jgi:hypothetical protein